MCVVLLNKGLALWKRDVLLEERRCSMEENKLCCGIVMPRVVFDPTSEIC